MDGEATDTQTRLGPLERLLIRECVSMTEHALGLGLRVPAAVAESVNVVSGVLNADGDSVVVS